MITGILVLLAYSLGALQIILLYQIGEDDGEWNYVKMTQDYDVITEITFNPDENYVPFSTK